ncbi:Aspartate aminotransferase [Abortiporus biennis]
MTSRIRQVIGHLSSSSGSNMAVSAESWNEVPLAPPDSIFKLTAAFKADQFPQKVNLGVGAYRDNEDKPWVLPVVKKATSVLLNDPNLDHEYLPITGLPEFTSGAAKLILGSDSPAIQEGRVTSVQTISGTGANHLGALFLSRFYHFSPEGGRKVWLSDPTWVNHFAIFGNVQIEPVTYPYYDPQTIGLAFKPFLDTLRNAPSKSVFLLHACAHNPTGVDPTRDQWKEICDVILEKGHYAFFDCAYQGFASGDLDNDAWAVRYFVSRSVPLLVCQSFAKNAGLYGERIGALHVVAPTTEAAARVKSQLSVLSRSEISNPPAHGARLVSLILNNPELFNDWKRDIETMANRIIEMRRELHRSLTEELKTPGNWDHIINQIGMFSFTGLNAEQSKAMVEKAHIYMTGNGRISMSGLNTHNIRYVAESLDKVVRGQL